MTSYIGCIPVSVIFDPDLPLSVVSLSIARSLGHPESVLHFSEIRTAAYQGCSLTTDVDFEVGCLVDADVAIGLNWIGAWCTIGRESDVALNFARRSMSATPGDVICTSSFYIHSFRFVPLAEPCLFHGNADLDNQTIDGSQLDLAQSSSLDGAVLSSRTRSAYIVHDIFLACVILGFASALFCPTPLC
ncbi:hypothetical protein DFJ58DRAFT_812896 [Suillus subalutaceus]|uniref:uncharacterized protein n=1 Tax=Suillus subalutaceus TaxID=48586 RepID=UPI001B87AF72|nr:uncharacterized protein DFJ58DRAFT_812896 [Suillus subalutaceus]KAG1839099.1 hypothetical protein DFJ58DRAFT_812896 [Suillus subalutaceus]